MTRHRLALTAAFALASLTGIASSQMEDLGSRDGRSALALYMSDDGETVAGYTFGAFSNARWAFRHTSAEGPTLLDALGEWYAIPVGISADGRYIAGELGGQRGVRWGLDGSLTELAPPGFPRHVPRAISADGNTLVGFFEQASGAGSEFRAFHWTEATGIVDIHPSFPSLDSSAQAVSEDGSAAIAIVIVRAISQPTRTVAARWTASTGMVKLIADDSISSLPFALSRDGRTVAGTMGPVGSADVQIFLWQEGAGVIALPTPSGTGGIGVRMSPDGSTVYGWRGDVAYHWSASTGYVEIPAALGFEPRASSLDGTVLAGFTSANGQPSRPARWTAAAGVELLPMPPLSLGGSIRAANADASSMTGVFSRPSFLSRSVRWRTDGTIGTAVECAPVAGNSASPLGAHVTLSGSNMTADADLVLNATDLPPMTVGLFLTSRSLGVTVGAGGSQGTLCLGGSIGRYDLPGQVMNSGADGTFTLSVDPSRFPTSLGMSVPMYGETRRFQAWYRDANPQPTSNFTDVVAVRVF